MNLRFYSCHQLLILKLRISQFNKQSVCQNIILSKMSQPQKQHKYNYLQHSFQKQLQRSYNPKGHPLSPSSMGSGTLNSPTNNQRYEKYHQNYNDLSRERSRQRQEKLDRHDRNDRHERSPQRSSEFSPYQNKQENVRDKILVQQLKNHNRVLTEQIQQYKLMLDKLQAELRIRVEEFAALDAVRQKEKVLHEQTMKQMRQQIGILLTKNTYLEQKTIVLQKDVKKYECEITKNQARTRSLSVVAATSKNHNSKLLQDITNILHNPISKQRQNGKLLNQTFSNLPSAVQSPSFTPSSPSSPESVILAEIQSLTHRLKKYEQLTESIVEMYQKINNKKISGNGLTAANGTGMDLKMIWKWLKELGHCFNIVQKWKKMLIDVLGIKEKAKDGDELSIQEVLQRTIVQLHAK